VPRADPHAEGNANKWLLTGYDLLVPKHWGRWFWHALIQEGACAIGVQDKDALMLQAGRLTFPRDFPDSMMASCPDSMMASCVLKGGERAVGSSSMPCWTSSGTASSHPLGEGAWQVFRRPELLDVCKAPVKSSGCIFPEEESGRARLGNQSRVWRPKVVGPMSVPSVLQGGWVGIFLEAIKGGVPEPHATLHLPLQEDLSHRKLTTPVECERVQVGFVTSGGFGFAEGRGIGIAFLEATGLFKIQLACATSVHNVPIVMVRNPRSTKYRAVAFRLMRWGR
jgi:hypothetical protein